MDSIIRRQFVTMDGAIHALAPLSILEQRYSDAKVKEWKEKAQRAQKVKNNAMQILEAKAKYTKARHETRVANHAYGMLAIAQDRDARQVQKAITQYSKACNPQQFLGVESRIRGILEGGNSAGQ